MTEWPTDTKITQLDSPNRDMFDDYAAVSERMDDLAIGQDRLWLSYVAKLSVDDSQAAFLLPHELPDASSEPRQVRRAIWLAMQRAYGGPQFRIIDYEMGRIQGTMRILLPQGIELQYHFNDELGWKATVVIITGNEERSFPAYYRKACMNPIRRAAIDGQVETSEVVFKPLEGEEIQNIAANPELDQMTARALGRLQRQYKMLARQGL